jgi:hypothetical protein
MTGNVRVIKLLPRVRIKIGPEQPAVGDTGTIRYALRDVEGAPTGYVVESVGMTGNMRWMAILLPDEIEPELA